jgi:hypothetical protein
MPKIQIPIDNGFYVSDSLPISNQVCTNWYANVPQVQGALSQGNLYGGAGITQLQTTGGVDQVNRGMHVKSGLPYFLNGEVLIRLDKSVDGDGNEVFTSVVMGTILGSGRVSMADNGKELMVLVPGGPAYIIDETSGTPFVEITDPSFDANGDPQLVVFIDSYFVCSTDSKKFIRSDSNNGTSWSALNVYTAESDPDDIVGLQVYNNKLFVLGSEVTEEFANNGGIFQRTGLFVDKGLSGAFATIATNNSFMWIGGGTNESAAVWTLNGNTPTKVSNTAIDSAIQNFTLEEIQEAFAYSYAKEGAYFVGFSFPTRTFEINTITGKWNERTSALVDDDGTVRVLRWRPNSVATAYGRVLCGDSQDGRIGSIDSNVYTEYAENIIRTFSTQVLSDQGNAIIISKLEATMEMGVGDLVTTNPQIRVSISKNGKTFDDEICRSIGPIGDYERRAILNRLGRYPRMCVVKVEMSDPVKPVFIKLEANIRGSQGGR